MDGTTDRAGDARSRRHAPGRSRALPAPGVRRFGRVNWLGLWTLYAREVWRFAKIWAQTLMAPLATAGLFMAVFHFALAERRGDVGGVPFTAFLAPGVLMMTVVQNAFANTSSSLIIAKVQGNIVDTLMPPLSPGELVAGYALSGATRGVAVGLAVGLPVFPALGMTVAEPLWALAFLVAGALALSLAGLIVGVLCWKFDQMAAITNFIVTPLAFLSGTFYSVADLPAAFQTVSRLNPVFHLIDGFRFGVLGAADGEPALALALAGATAVVLWLAAWLLFRRGAGLKA
ncbi:MAG: multidrug ABC transporter permease [Rhodobacteraceae bacterium]|nr:MAG: multidrug ABC transporter permease [Paracoccaceae bacterium]